MAGVKQSVFFRILKKVSRFYLSKPVEIRNNAAREFLNNLPDSGEKYIIITSKSAWKYFDNLCSITDDERGQILLNPPLEYEELTKIGDNMKTDAINVIIGIGGGRMMDVSKALAWYLKKSKVKTRLILIPSITSTTSWLNMGFAIRKDNTLFMPGNYHANKIIFDPEYLRNAPINLNTGGIADLLVCNSAIIDWNISYNHEILMGHKNKEHNPVKGSLVFTEFSNYTIERFSKLISEMNKFDVLTNKPEILGIYPEYFSEKFIMAIYDTFLNSLALCGAIMSGRPLEGSEHFFYYALDESDDRTWNHGAIIAFSTLLSLNLQEIFLKKLYYSEDNSNDKNASSDMNASNASKPSNELLLKELYNSIPEKTATLKRLYTDLKIEFRPSQLGLEHAVIKNIVKNMKEFVIKNDYYHTIWNYFDMLIESKESRESKESKESKEIDEILTNIINWIEAN